MSSLSETAAQAAQRSQQLAAERKAEELRAAGTLAAKRLGDLLGIPSTHLDSIEGTHPVDRSRRYEHYIGRDHHTIHRLLVDDVVMWWIKLGEVTLGVERPCRNCGRPHFAGMDVIHGPQGYDAERTPDSRPASTGISQDDMRRRYDEARTPQKRAGYVLEIGRALGKNPLCWDCQIGVPFACPTCGRPNEKEG